MRTQDQIKHIKDYVSDPYVIENLINQGEANYLVDMFEEEEILKVHKKTGPVTIDWKHDVNTHLYEDPVVQEVLHRLEKHIGPFDINAALYFHCNGPFTLHNDDNYEFAHVYKGITLPLKLHGPGEDDPGLVMFDQFYFHGPAKFLKGLEETDPYTYFNKILTTYEGVEGLTDVPFDEEWRQKYIPHIDAKYLEGLSVHSVMPWVPGNAIVFDSTRIHCATNYKRLGYTNKQAISIFTRHKRNSPYYQLEGING